MNLEEFAFTIMWRRLVPMPSGLAFSSIANVYFIKQSNLKVEPKAYADAKKGALLVLSAKSAKHFSNHANFRR